MLGSDVLWIALVGLPKSKLLPSAGNATVGFTVVDDKAVAADGIRSPATRRVATRSFNRHDLLIIPSFIENNSPYQHGVAAEITPFHYKYDALAMFLLICRTEGPKCQNSNVSDRGSMYLSGL